MISNISLALLIITIIFLSLYMILQGNRQDKSKLRNAGLALFLVTNVGVIFIAQSILMSEDRKPIYNLDYIRSEEANQNEGTPYDTAKLAYMDLVRSPLPTFLSNLQATAKGEEPYKLAYFEYQIKAEKLSEYLGSLTPPADSIVVPIATDRFAIQWDSCSQFLLLKDLIISPMASHYYVQGTYGSQWLQVDSSGSQIRHIAFRY